MATTSFKFKDVILFVSSKYVGEAKPWDGRLLRKQHHVIVRRADDYKKKLSFEYFSTVEKFTPKLLLEALFFYLGECMIPEAYKDAYEFAFDMIPGDSLMSASEFIQLVKKEVSDYKQLEAQEQEWKSLGIDLYELSNYLQETNDF